MQAIENKIINRVYGHGRGWVFFKNDFSDLGSAEAIDQALSRLAKSQRIRRVMRGLYDYPRFSSLLNKEVASDIDQVANALARKFGWAIQVSGNTALNVLGLSTQMPGKYLYLSNAKTIRYELGNQELSFKKAPLKESGLKYHESALLVQAIKAMDKRELGPTERRTILDYFDAKSRERILKDTRYTTSWVYEIIKDLFKEDS